MWGDMIKPTIFTYVLARQKFIRHCCLLLELQTLSNVYSNRQLEGRAEIKHFGLCAVFNTPIRLQHDHTIQSAILRYNHFVYYSFVWQDDNSTFIDLEPKRVQLPVSLYSKPCRIGRDNAFISPSSCLYYYYLTDQKIYRLIGESF
jgi:hypothetical protein